jgi:tRNA A-37 threonylcarbamoyl transferase component Bud32
MSDTKSKMLPAISHQTPNVLDQSDVMSFMPNADFFLWFTPVVSKLAIVIALTPMFLFLLGYMGVLNSLVFPLTIAYINSLKPFLQMAVSDQFAPMMYGMTSFLYVVFGLLGIAVTALTIRILSNSNSLCLTAKGISLGTASNISGNSQLQSSSLSSASVSAASGIASAGSLNSAASPSSLSNLNLTNTPNTIGGNNTINSSIGGATSIIAKNQVIYQERDELDFKQVTEIEIIRPKTTRSNLDYVFVFRRGIMRPFKIRYGDILKASDRAIFVAAIKEKFSEQIDDELLEPFEIAGEKQGYTELWLKELSASPKRDKLTPLELGAQLHNNRYTIISKIGMGGQGTVYLAQDNHANANQSYGVVTKDGVSKDGVSKDGVSKDGVSKDGVSKDGVPKELVPKEVVLKEFLLPVFPDSRVRKAAAIKFQEEADLLGKLEHPQIVKFFQLFLEDHRAYLVLEKLDGITLKDHIESKGSLPEESIVDLARQMCNILQYLHNQTPPVVHRDFTPDNLILSEDGTLKLLDFSVAQSVTSNVTGSVVGKPHYIAPEQFRGKSSSQSDIYSMGATLYFLATGKQPEPITNLKLVNAKTSSDSKNVTDSKTSTDSKNSTDAKITKETKLSRVIEKSTKLDLANRYKQVEEILRDLA